MHRLTEARVRAIYREEVKNSLDIKLEEFEQRIMKRVDDAINQALNNPNLRNQMIIQMQQAGLSRCDRSMRILKAAFLFSGIIGLIFLIIDFFM